MDLWRSEEMQLVQLIIPAEAAHDTVSVLGEVGALQFKDLNPEKSGFQRTYANQVKRCDEMARKLRFFSEQVEKSTHHSDTMRSEATDLSMDELEAKLEELERELLELNSNTERITRSHAELMELQLVLEKAGSFFDEARCDSNLVFDNPLASGDAGSSMDAPLLDGTTPESKVVRLGFVAGMIETDKLHAFERLLFRSTRGNMYLRQSEVGAVMDPAAAETREKAVFVVFFAGERARLKILKICEAFGANKYPFPEDPGRQRQMHAEVTARLRELQTTMDAGETLRANALGDLAGNLPGWVTLVRREKAVYHTLNKLSIDVTRKCLVAEAWCPEEAKGRVQDALRAATERSHAAVGTVFQPLATREQPPTYFKTDKLTEGFQSIVDAYGIARYREVNPAVFTIITFPFLFAVMFGDMGHAALMLMFALLLIIKEKALGAQTLNDMVAMAFGGRYVILLMSIFSIFTGMIYNEFFAIALNMWGNTHYVCPGDPDKQDADWRACDYTGEEEGLVMEEPGSPYVFGIDPVWRGTKTELPFLNSVKMKMSIIMGVTQMVLGIIMSLFNHLHFRDYLSIWAEFIPQMIFLLSLFGYLSFLIIYKWIAWPTLEDRSAALSSDGIGRPPDLYHVMIYMFLSPGDIDCGAGGKPAAETAVTGVCTENNIFDGQGAFQNILVLLALVAVPWMLLPKPLVLRARAKKAAEALDAGYGAVARESQEMSPGDVEASGGSGGGHGGGHGHGEEFEFGEVMVHQMIHTIEFVLGAVSNTASYLRLWALSLAHSQLSAVFFERVLLMTIELHSPLFQVIGFFVWAMATFGVLMIMESLSAFLHALRLHWVEFQNKFYHGDGYQFTPFAFAVIDKEEL